MLFAVLGFFIAMIVGVTGIGGGSLMTPALVLLFGIPVATAVGTDLIYAAMTKLIATMSYSHQGFVNYRIAMLLLLGSLPSAVMTVFILGSSKVGGDLLLWVLAISLILTAGAIFIRGKIQALLKLYFADREDKLKQLRRFRPFLVVIVGGVLGVLVTLSSVGAGVLGTACLIWMYPNLSLTKVIGTELFHALILTVVAGFGHVMLGNVDWLLLLYLMMGAIPGAYLGSRLIGGLPEVIMQKIVAIIVGLVGGMFLLKGILN